MKVFTLFSLLHGLLQAGAEVDYSDWRAPEPDDLRGPCPVLNSVANHGIIPRDGRNMSLALLLKRLPAAINVSVEFATALALAALETSCDPRSFTLADLNKHNLMEHDGSLSRQDYDLAGEAQNLHNETFEEFLSYFGGSQRVTLGQVAAARWGRVQSARSLNSNFSYSPYSRAASYAESATYYLLLHNSISGRVPLEHIKILFQQERLPHREGWRPVNKIDTASLATTMLKLALLTPESPMCDGGDIITLA